MIGEGWGGGGIIEEGRGWRGGVIEEGRGRDD